jgi:hypothetical protein
MLRVVLAISVLIAALLMTGVGAGVALADPDDSGNVSDTDPAPEEPGPSEPEPTTGLPTGLPTVTTSPPSIFDIPRNIANQLRDMLGRPLSIFGNGRVPGTHTDGTTPDPAATTGRKNDKPKKAPATPKVEPPEPVAVAPPPKPRASSSVEVRLPFTPPISVSLPSLQVPGYQNMRWSLDLTDPRAAYTSVGATLNTVNSLLADAYAPYNPFKPPAPKPTFRTFEEEPVVDVTGSGGSGGANPLSATSQLPILQAPVVVPRVQVPQPLPPSMPRPVAPPLPKPVAETAPAGTQAVPGAGAPMPAVRGPAPPRDSVPNEQLPLSGNTTAMVNPTLREGYPQYLRSARMAQVATVALPGLGGLIALTASGGVIGFRQANSGRYLRTDAARFLR